MRRDRFFFFFVKKELMIINNRDKRYEQIKK